MDFELQFSDKEITPWGGLGLIPHPALIPAALALRGVREKPARLES